MPSSEWPTPEAIQNAAEALHEKWPRLGILSRAVVYHHPSKVEIATVALTAAARASPVIRAPRCGPCDGSGQDARYTDQTPCADCHGTGVAEVKAADIEGRDAARILAVTSDASLLDEDSEVDDLFERGLIRTERGYTDEYHAVMTEAGAAFVRRVVNSEPVAEVIPVAALLSKLGEMELYDGTSDPPPSRGSGYVTACREIRAWLDEHTRKEPNG